MRDLPPLTTNLREIVQAIRQLIAGRNNATVDVTLTANVTSTTVTGPNINVDGRAFLSPLTANAAAALSTTFAVVSRVSGVPTVTITHASAATTDRSFALTVTGG